jgi:histidinol-phosphate/aromatic aminotransferase/cobyric acid decarboxylase-like protein
VRACYDREYARETRGFVTSCRGELAARLSKIDKLTLYPGQANYLFIRIDHPTIRANDVSQFLLTHGIAIRECSSYTGLDDRFFRVAVGTPEENRLLAAKISDFFS